MFEGIKTDGPFGGGYGESMFRSLMIEHYSKTIADQGGFGLADQVKREILAASGDEAMTTPANIDPADHAMQRRMENLLAMSNRLCDAISTDIAALEKGEFGDLASTDPEVGRLCALYGREVMALKNSGGIKNVPVELVDGVEGSGRTAEPSAWPARKSRRVHAPGERGPDPGGRRGSRKVPPARRAVQRRAQTEAPKLRRRDRLQQGRLTERAVYRLSAERTFRRQKRAFVRLMVRAGGITIGGTTWDQHFKRHPSELAASRTEFFPRPASQRH